MDSNQIEQKVLDFFKSFEDFHIKVENKDSIINPANLFDDEAIIMLEEFVKKFDIQEGYLEVDKYFNPFAKFRLQYWYDIIRFKKHKYEQKPPITIAHMIEVAKRKEWFDPE